MSESLVSRETALLFLQKINVHDAQELMVEEPLQFINKLIQCYQEHVPFQCVGIIAQTKEEKHVPTLEEIVEDALSLEGGVCFTLNTFICILLRALDFMADIVDGSFSAFGDTHTHVVVILRNLRHAEDDYIIDMGSGFPFESAVALSELPCTRKWAGLEYKYEWRDDFIVRLHRVTDDNLSTDESPLLEDGWRKVFHFDLKPVAFDHFRPYMENIYVNEVACDFHSTLRAIRFVPAEEGSGGCATMLAFKNRTLLVSLEDGIQKTKCDPDNWADKIIEHFPNIPQWKVDVAVKYLLDLAEAIA